MSSALPTPILNVSFYRFVKLENLEALREELKTRAIELGLKGSILLSEEGINGFLAGDERTLRSYLEWLFSKEPFRGISPKESFSSTVPFTRMLVKVKKEIISMGRPEIRPSESTGKRLSPAELKKWYDEKKDFVIVDTRNTYEVAEGTFRNAIHYGIETFRQFPEKLEKEAKQLQDKPVVMFCTGGIRCEKATALALDLGVKDVYQLEGGILKYFEEVGQAHYRGDCFVFDHRSNVDAGLEAAADRRLRKKMEGLSLRSKSEDIESLRVRLVLEAKKIPHVMETGIDGEPNGPVLVHDTKKGDPLVLGKTSIILDYLEDEFPERFPLLPRTEERRARMRLWIDWIDGVFARSAMRWIRERDGLSPANRFDLEGELEKHLHRLKTPLQRKRRFLVVDAPTLADFAAYSVLLFLRGEGFPSDYPERFSVLWEWMERMSAMVPKASSPSPIRDTSTRTCIPSDRNLA